MKNYVLFLILAAISFTACKTLVPNQSPVISYEAAFIKVKTDSLYSKIQAAPSRQYANFSVDYLAIRVLYDSIVAQQLRRSQAKNLMTITTNAQAGFLQYQSYHQQKDGLTDTEISIARKQLDRFINPLIYAESKLPTGN